MPQFETRDAPYDHQDVEEATQLIARLHLPTAIGIIANILDQLTTSDGQDSVAKRLVGATFQHRFGQQIVSPESVNAISHDGPADFLVNDAAIVVTTKPPYLRQADQIVKFLREINLAIWLLVRNRERQRWQHVMDAYAIEAPIHRVIVIDIESFIGQSLTAAGAFDRQEVSRRLTELFRIYNKRWLPAAGSLRIVDDALVGN